MDRTWKKYLALLVLGLPVGGYVAREGLRASAQQLPAEVPAVALPPAPPPLPAAAKPDEARHLARAVLRFQPTKPDAKHPRAVAAAVDRAADRADELHNLRLYLGEVADPAFVGHDEAKERWRKLAAARGASRDKEQTLLRLPGPAEVQGADDARERWAEIDAAADELLRHRQVPEARVATLRAEARVRLLKRLDEYLADRYTRALKADALPAEPVAGLPDAFRLAREWAELLKGADAAGAADLAEARPAVWDAWAAALDLLAKNPALLGPDDLPGAVKLLAGLHALHRDAEGKRLVRRKVQQVCNGFVPAKLRLGPTVVLGDVEVDRKKVLLDTKPERATRPVLTDDPDGLNELTLKDQLPELNAIYGGERGPFGRKDLTPTRAGRRAVAYNAARGGVARWTADEVAKLRLALVPADPEERDPKANDLPAQNGPAGRSARALDRLDKLAAAIAAHPDLFPPTDR